MRKLALLMATALLTLGMVMPARGSTEWNFGATLRFATYYNTVDYGKVKGGDLEGGGATGLSSDGRLDWTTQNNSQLRFFMRGDNLRAYIELGYNSAENAVSTRAFWGQYTWGNGWALKIGQEHQLFSTLGFANQAWANDMAMHSMGTSFNPPTPKIVLSYKDFAFALAQPYKNSLGTLGVTAGVNHYSADIDTYFPQIQASYQHRADTWRLKLAGAFQTYKLKHLTGPALAPSGPKNRTVNSWLLVVDGDVSFGPLYLKAALSGGQNWADAQWNVVRGGLPADLSHAKVLGQFGFKLNGSGQIKNTTSAMAALVAGYRLTPDLIFEAGVAYRYDDNNIWKDNSNMWNTYIQAVYTVAPGFTVTPEVGYIDLGKTMSANKRVHGLEAGYIFYAGAKWQMDF